MENVRFNISPCTPEEAKAFISKIDETVYQPRSMVPADGRSHYDRYAYSRDDSRVAIVYDTRANVISITASPEHSEELLHLFGASGDKMVKRSTVPAQNSKPASEKSDKHGSVSVGMEDGRRARVFVSNQAIRGRESVAPTRTVVFNSRGQELSTDEIFPPQRVYKKTQSYVQDHSNEPVPPEQSGVKPRLQQKSGDAVGGAGKNINATVDARRARRPVICFGDEEDDAGAEKVLRSGTGLFADMGEREEENQARFQPPVSAPAPAPEKRRRGRPPKHVDYSTADIVKVEIPEYKNGYSVKNYPKDALDGMLKRLRSNEKYRISDDGTENPRTPQEVRSYSVTDDVGQKVTLRYATGKCTLSLQGKRSELFGEIQSQVSRDSDYSSALEDYVDAAVGKNKVSEVQARLKKRLPTAFDFLSEQSRIEFSYGIHDFNQTNLQLSDYSVLLVPSFRGLERFVFDLQRSEGINVKMIGQAFDKNDSGKYILKNGYVQRIGSVVYAEVLVSLYTEYFSQRNFFAHTDNTGGGVSRSISDKAAAKRIFDHLLDVVEYNARKLKEIGFVIRGEGNTKTQA